MPQPRKYRNRADQQAAYRQRTRRSQELLLRQRGLPAMPAIPTMPGKARWQAALEQASGLLSQTAIEMHDYHDDRSEKWQDGPQAEDLLERAQSLEDIADQIQDVASAT